MIPLFLHRHHVSSLIRRIRRGFLILLCMGWVGMGGLAETMAHGPSPGTSHPTASADQHPEPSSMDRLSFWAAVAGLAASSALSILLVRLIRRRRHLESFLRETDQKWRALVENAPDHIMLLDLDGHILFANRGFMGAKKPDLIGKSLAGLVASPFSETLGEQLKTVAMHASSGVCRVEREGRQDRSGSVFELRMGPVQVNQLTVAIAVNSTEITEHVNQERALRESEAFHRTFFDNTPTAIAIQDFSAVEASVKGLRAAGIDDLRDYLETHPHEVSRLAGSVIMRQVNPAFLALYQAPDASAILGPLALVLKSDDRTHFIDQIVAFTSGHDDYEGEARNLDLKGRTLHLIIRKVVIERRQNGLSKVLTCLIDITPLKKAEKERRILTLQLQQAQKMEAIGTLAGGVAHDFNNILSIILGNVELSLSDISPEHPAFMNLQEIQQASLRARDIVRQLLSLSRKDEALLKPIHLAPIVTEAVKFLRATMPANIGICTDLSIGKDVVRPMPRRSTK
ncbi:PAS domain S-box protein [Desulfosarcina cetonica]|uniref:PAS domain S-box protein n=1 Tax=Desulfosarcina cetonica TaxID=90730 RepID=UPI0006CF278B|nr:PAS domain S-box protein [Desulfosarcina cetonica]